jgi:hypothetical protein
MNDRRINNLVRMAMEVEELEGHASTPGLRLVGEPIAARPREWLATRAGMTSVGLAAAAGLALVFALPAMLHMSEPTKTMVATNTDGNSNAAPQEDIVIVKSLKQAQPVENPERPSIPGMAMATERVDPGSVERSLVMAIYRGARGQMQCVKIKPHEWSENKCLTEVTPQELRCVPVGQACTASADHALMVALSGPQKSLPRNESDAVHLATCILGVPCENDSKCYSLSAAHCVPEGVSVRIETVADSR